MSDNLLDGEGNVESLPAGAGISAAIGVPLPTQNVRIAAGHLPYSGVYATSEPKQKNNCFFLTLFGKNANIYRHQFYLLVSSEQSLGPPQQQLSTTPPDGPNIGSKAEANGQYTRSRRYGKTPNRLKKEGKVQDLQLTMEI